MKSDELGRQAARPAEYFAESVKKMKGRDEDKRPISLSTSCRFQKLDEMVKNGNYRPAKEEENDAVQHGAAG